MPIRYPSGYLHLSLGKNKLALDYFLQGQEQLNSRNFHEALSNITYYKSLIDYADFTILDNRYARDPLLSVIIVAYKTNFDLISCLKSVLRASDETTEVIVVDNGQNEEVHGILTKLPILYIQNPFNLILSEARNIGMAHARATICAFLDDDALVPPSYPASILKAFENEHILAIRGKILPKCENAAQGTSWHYDLGNLPFPYNINTEGCSAWRRETYLDAGGMDPLLFGHEGTDLSISYALTYGLESSCYWPELFIYHDYALTEDKASVKSRRHELMRQYLKWKNPSLDSIHAAYENMRKKVQEKIESTSPLPRPITPKKAFRKKAEPESICFFIRSLGPGGAERQLASLAKTLSNSGKKVHILCLHLDSENGHFLHLLKGSMVSCRILTDQDKEYGIAFMQSHPDRFSSITALRISDTMSHETVLMLVGALLQIRPDIIHCYLDDACCVGGCAALASGVPGIILSARSTTPEKLSVYHHLATWTRRAYKFLLQHPNVLLEANSSTGAKDYEDWLELQKGSVYINNNGFIPENQVGITRQSRLDLLTGLGIPTSSPIVLWIGKYNTVKRPQDLVNIAYLVRENIKNVCFLAVGNLLGQEEKAAQLLNQSGLEKAVYFTGTRTDVANLLDCADALLLTSEVEGFPNAVLEAMHASLPVVATKVGAIPEMVSAKTGFIHEVGDTSGMAESLITLLTDKCLRMRMGIEALKKAQHFSMDNLLARTIANYKEVYSRD